MSMSISRVESEESLSYPHPYWLTDPKFLEFNDRLYDEEWTFDQTLSNVHFQDFEFDNMEFLRDIKRKWNALINDWNREGYIKSRNKTKAYAAIIFLFILIPYNDMKNLKSHFTLFDMNMINIAYFYNTGGIPLCINEFELEDISYSGSIDQLEYHNWLDDKYNTASWFITLMVFEKNYGYPRSINCPPAFNKDNSDNDKESF